jgi:hypothetical protein
MRTFVSIAACLVIAACSSNPGSTEPVVYSQSEVADSIAIRVGRTIIVDGIRFRFDVVESDSRCPMDVVCVWAGDAVARFVVEQSGAPSSGVSLQLHTNLQPKSGSAHGFRVELLALQPYPRASTPTKADDYVASIKVIPAS